MANVQTIHPTAEQLRAFLLGHLADNLRVEIEQHVASCEVCCETLRDVPDDTMIGRLRDADTSPEKTVDLSAQPQVVDLPDELPAELANHPRYRVTKQLGRGGMGAVYQAEHRLMERQVAIKVINQSLIRSAKAVERFRLEVKAAAKLSHPNIVTAFDADQAGDSHFLVMELVEGVDLDRQVSQRGPLPTRHACHFVRQAALGLQHAHERHMVHRDIKPHNLMLTKEGRIKILDFGLARFASEASLDGELAAANRGGLTQAGVAMGTPDYMAPEQCIDASSADIRSDIYSLGCTLYFLLSGQPPFPRGSAMEKISSHLERKPRPIRELRDDTPAELASIVEQMMAREPDQRFQTPSEVAEALAPFTRSESSYVKPPPISAPAETSPPLPLPNVQMSAPVARRTGRERPRRRRPALFAGIAVVAVAATAGALFTNLPSMLGRHDGPIQGSELRGVSDEFDHGVRKTWMTAGEEFGSISAVDGKLEIMPSDNTTLCGDGRSPIFYQDVAGDFMVTASIVSDSKSSAADAPSHPMNMAGLVVRNEKTESWTFFGLGSVDDGNEGSLLVDSASAHLQQWEKAEGLIRIARLGSQLHVLRRQANEATWTQVRESAVTTEPVRVGITAGSYQQPSDLRATFDFVRFQMPSGPDDLVHD